MENILTTLKNLEINSDEMISYISPYISEKMSENSKEGKKAKRKRFKNLIHMILNFYLKQIKFFKRENTSKIVKNKYNEAYSKSTFDGYKSQGRFVTYIYKKQVYQMNGMGNYRSKSFIIEKITKIIKPKSMCEIGCGKGRHLFYFSTIFPKTKFFGLDLSEKAISIAKQTQVKKEINLFLPEKDKKLPKNKVNLVRKIDFNVGNANNLSMFKNNSFEVVYTVNALEQMASDLPEVLEEIHRITSKFVVFCEPFWDYNNFFEKQYLIAGNYFRLKEKILNQYGFEKINFLDCLLLKPSFKDSVYIGKVIK